MVKKIITGILLTGMIGLFVYSDRQPCETEAGSGLCSTDQAGNTNMETRGYVWGVDLSHHQENVDWEVLVQRNKPDFIFLKATEGATHTDTRYRQYLRKAREHNIPAGAYHFFSYTSKGKDQAANFIQVAGLRKGDLFPVLDVEFKKNMKPKEWIISEIKSFCDAIHSEYGVFPIIYCECDYYRKYLTNDFSDYSYWISDLHREPNCGYVFWQYTENGLVHGIGRIDNNRLHKKERLSDFVLK